MSLFTGLSPLAAGFLLEARDGLSGRFLTLDIGPFTPRFALTAALLAAGALIFARIRGSYFRQRGDPPALSSSERH